MKRSLTLVLLLIWLSVKGQLIVIDSLKINSVELLSIDKSGDLYVGDIHGNVLKLDAGLEELQRFSPSRKGGITTLDAWNPLRGFVGFGDIQEYVFLDRFLVSENRFSLQDISSYVGVCAPSMDNNIWLVDYADFSLKKYNISFNQIEINRAFDLVLNPNDYEISQIREYQNLVFMCDSRSGILVFDNLGNYLYTITYDGILSFSFWKNEINFLRGTELISRDLYTEDLVSIPMPKGTLLAVKTEKYYFFYRNNWLFKARE